MCPEDPYRVTATDPTTFQSTLREEATFRNDT